MAGSAPTAGSAATVARKFSEWLEARRGEKPPAMSSQVEYERQGPALGSLKTRVRVGPPVIDWQFELGDAPIPPANRAGTPLTRSVYSSEDVDGQHIAPAPTRLSVREANAHVDARALLRAGDDEGIESDERIGERQRAPSQGLDSRIEIGDNFRDARHGSTGEPQSLER